MEQHQQDKVVSYVDTTATRRTCLGRYATSYSPTTDGAADGTSRRSRQQSRTTTRETGHNRVASTCLRRVVSAEGHGKPNEEQLAYACYAP